jgi:hypothetical protein
VLLAFGRIDASIPESTSVIIFERILVSVWHTGCAMLIEIWERLRGYDKWIETEATIESTEVVHYDPQLPSGRSYCHHVILWTDSSGERHRSEYTAKEGMAVFQLVEGSTFTIRFNPVHPEEYYHRSLLQRDIRLTAEFAIFALVVTLPITCLLLFGHSSSK